MEAILNNPKFQKVLSDICAKTGQNIMDAHRDASEYLGELETLHKPVANILGTQMAQYILSRGYEKTIDVDPAEIKALTKLARKHSIAFVMTHKTYIDMFVLAVVMARHGLPLPFTFAGINMDFMGFGQFGRQNGVIFIRRNIKENPVYRASLQYFIAHLVDQKSHFMWAIEGTRSRTGKLVWPKMGILKYIMDAEQTSQHDVKYVPVSIVYDLIPDVKEMMQELRGKSKSPESLAWFVQYVRKMGDKFGKISIRIGEPVNKTDDSASIISLNQGNVLKPHTEISKFAMELVHRINTITPVTTASLICIILMSKYTLQKRAIESYVSVIMQLIEGYKPDALVDRGKPIGESVQKALNLLKKAELIRQHGDGVHAKYVIASNNYLQATYYANMAVHHLQHQAFIELAMLKTVNESEGDPTFTFWKEIMDLRNLFKFEFFYSKKGTFIEEVEANLDFLAPDWNNQILQPKKHLPKLIKAQRMLIAPVVLSTYIEAYRVVAQGLLDWENGKPFNEKQFIEDCLFVGEAMQWQGMIQRIESVSKPFLENGLRLCKNINLIPAKGDEKSEALNAFLAQLDNINQRILELQRISLSNAAEVPAVPLERSYVPGSRTETITHDILKDESGSHIGAFFDLDRTLIKGFSAKEFFQNRLFSGKMTAKEIVAQLQGVLVYASGMGNFASLAAVGAKGIKDVDERVFLEVSEEVYEKHLASEIYPESRSLVAAHLAKGHTVAIISAATPYQVDPIARDLGIDHVMCTRLEVVNGKFTGEIVEPACWGAGKAHAAEGLVKQFDLDLSKSYFYTDSAEDMPLLEIVGKPRPMNPDAKLSAIAFQNDWPIYRFNDDERPKMTSLARTGLALGSLFPAALSGVLGSALNGGDRKEGVNSMIATVGDLVCMMAGIQLVVKGEEHLWDHRPAVFILNHQSNADLFIASKLLRKDIVGVAKKELKNMPLIGQMMSAAGIIFLDRKNRAKAIEAMKPAVDVLHNGTSIVIFPEGTRSKDYTLQPFKKGAFHIAMQAQVPLVPIVIRNAHDAMPKGKNIFQPAVIDIKVLPPISTEGWTKTNLTENIDRVRKQFLRELKQDDGMAEVEVRPGSSK